MYYLNPNGSNLMTKKYKILFSMLKLQNHFSHDILLSVATFFSEIMVICFHLRQAIIYVKKITSFWSVSLFKYSFDTVLSLAIHTIHAKSVDCCIKCALFVILRRCASFLN